jgi:hypothetical protein
VVVSYLDRTLRADFHIGVRIAGLKVFPKPSKDDSKSQLRFTQPGRSRPIKGDVRCSSILIDETTGLDVSDVEISFAGGPWQPFTEWVENEYGSRKGPTYTLSKWWRVNGRSFRFMDLPSELRMCVYEQLIGPYIWPHPALKKTKKINYFCPQVYPEEARAQRPPVLGELFLRAPSGHRAPTPTQVPAVSKEVAAEFGDFIAEHTQPHFRFPNHLFLLIYKPKFTHTLRRISIGAPNWRLFRLLGYRSTRHRPFQPVHEETAHISMFKHIPTLEHLNFHFQVAPLNYYPLKMGERRKTCFNWDPWHRLASNLGAKEVSCQRVFVDWFLTFALEYFRHLKKITLSGHVKDSTRTKWEAIFEREKTGMRHYMGDEIARIMALPYTNL